MRTSLHPTAKSGIETQSSGRRRASSSPPSACRGAPRPLDVQVVVGVCRDLERDEGEDHALREGPLPGQRRLRSGTSAGRFGCQCGAVRLGPNVAARVVHHQTVRNREHRLDMLCY